MNYTTFNAGGKEYKLRLPTSAVIKLEERLGYNPLHIFGDGTQTPKVTNLVDFLWAALYINHNVSYEEACILFDAWLDDGNTPPEFLPIIIEVYKNSGLIKKVKN